ncbi:hypothetical protein [Humibacillus xanthopallidus]|uniref:hypothetical protein n=1 Tax=Humibacillus xanthopallidus TaxID=412689 RepID=UPI00384E84F6
MDDAVEVPDDAMSRPADRRVHPPLRQTWGRRVWPIVPLAFVGWWLVGALPWVVTGLDLTPRLTTARDRPPEPYLSTLPFLTGQLPLLVVLTMCAGAVSAFAVLWTRPHDGRRVRRALAALTGALAATAYTVVQSAGAARQSAGTFDGDARVLRPLVAIAVACSLGGFVLGLCVAYGRPVLRALATAPLAVLTVNWLSALTVALLGPAAAPLLVGQTRWLVGILLGLALATVGLRPARRIVTWVVALASVWVLDAAITALAYVTVLLRPGAGLPGNVREVADAGRDVFVQALLAYRPGPLVLAVVVGLAGALLLPRLRPRGDGPRSAAHPSSESGPSPVAPRDHAATGPRAPEPAARHTDDAAAR